MPRSPWRPTTIRRQWLSPKSSSQNGLPWRISIAWCQGTATTAQASSATRIAEPQLRAPQPPPVPGEAEVGEEDDHRQPQPGEPLGQHRQAAQHRRDVEVERRLVARAAPQDEEGERSRRCTAASPRRPAASRRALRQGNVQRSWIEVDDQLRQRDQREERRPPVEERVVGPAEPSRPSRAGAAAAARPRRRTAPARPAPAPSSSARRRPCRSSPAAPPGCTSARSRSPCAARTPARRLTKRETHR